MRRSPFIKPILPTLPKIGTTVRIKQGSSHHPIPFQSAVGEIVHIDDDRKGGTLTVKVKLPTGTVVKGLSFADLVELDSTSWTVTTHEYDRVVQGKDGHQATDLSAPTVFRAAPNPPTMRPIMAPRDAARNHLERKASAHQKLAADAWWMMQVAGSMQRYAAAARAHARHSADARKILLDLVQPERVTDERQLHVRAVRHPLAVVEPRQAAGPVLRDGGRQGRGREADRGGESAGRPRMDGSTASMIFKVSPDYGSAYLARKGDTYGLAINGADLARLRKIVRERPTQRSQILADFYNQHI